MSEASEITAYPDQEKESTGITFIIQDLDRAANAFDQRAMPTALARFSLFFGVIFLGVGLLPPLTYSFIWIGIGALLGGLALLLPFWYPRQPWVALLGGIFALLLALVFTVNAMIALTSFTHLSVPLTLNKTMTDALNIANLSYRESPWFLARLLAAIPTLLYGIELFIAGWLLLRLNKTERTMLTQRSKRLRTTVLEFLFDISPGFIRYSQGYRFWMMWWLLATAPFAFALTNIVGARSLENLIAVTRVVDCVNAGAQLPNCFDEYVLAHTLGMMMMTVVSIPLLIWAGNLLTGWLRKRLANHNHSKRKRDLSSELDANNLTSEILFLRSAEDDSVYLRTPAWTPMRYALSPGIRLTPDLDSLLVGELSEYGSTLALSGEGRRPFGANRMIIADGDKIENGRAKWKQEIASIIDRVKHILIVLDETIVVEKETEQEKPLREGLRWELRHIAGDATLLGKTTIMIKMQDRPQTRQGKQATLVANHAIWNKVRSLTDNRIDVPTFSEPLTSLAYDRNMKPHMTTASRMTSTTARLILRLTVDLAEMTARN